MDEPATTGAGAIEALRSANGLTLVVWPAERRRAALPDGRGLADLSAAEHEALREAAVPLTATESLLERQDALWLVQQTGPAWAEPSEASAEQCGLLFTRLDGSGHRERMAGMAPGPLPDGPELERLLDELEAAKAAEEASGADADGASGAAADGASGAGAEGASDTGADTGPAGPDAAPTP